MTIGTVKNNSNSKLKKYGSTVLDNYFVVLDGVCSRSRDTYGAAREVKCVEGWF